MIPIKKKTLLSAIQPTNVAHLGNYLGAIKRWVAMQNDYRCFFFLVDLHALTVRPKPEELKQGIYQVVAFYLAAGLDPKSVTLFCQSHVPAHAELTWVLDCFTYMGELSRMTQYKEKSLKQGANIPVGLFNYPVLMACDILLYDVHHIPVGEDQKQHVELCRDIAKRFNHFYDKPVFQIPEPMIAAEGARIMDLQNPLSKMSKSSDNPKGTLFMNDSDKDIAKKIKSAVTDSGSEVLPENNSAGIHNLIHIYATLENIKFEQALELFIGKPYGHLKVAAADLSVAHIAPIRERMNELIKDKTYLNSILKEGALVANEVARKKLKAVYEVMGLIV